MKKSFCILLVLTLCASFQLTALASERTGKLPSGIAYSDIEAKVDAYAAEHKDTTAAVSVAVFHNDEVLMEKSYGYTNLENHKTNDSDAVFEWGSCTKLLTWVSAMQLSEQGKLDLNKDIREYLPEGFFKKLKYDTPITMLNLMNHNAGWQETVTDLFIKNSRDVKELGDALHTTEPAQIHKPGEIVAYSNWGAALAGYIVERISGQSFSDYVHANIFTPLGMEHTALNADLSDNDWVAKMRAKENCYTTTGDSLGTCLYYLPMYPAGKATGTLSDFLKFAQALVPRKGERSPLFDKAETLDELFSPSLYYSDQKTARICHGFWTDELGVPVLWHNGGTVGSTSWLAFNRETGIGMVILTNQSDEAVYNCGLLPLVFGKYTQDDTTEAAADISGVYANQRSCYKGYAKLYSLFGTMQLVPDKKGGYTVPGTDFILVGTGKKCYLMDMGLKQFVTFKDTDDKGRTILEMAGSDYVMINGYGVIAKFSALILYVIAALYSLVLLLRKLFAFLRHKKTRPMDGYRILLNLSVVTSLALFVYIALRLFMTNSAMYVQICWSLIACAVLTVIPIIYLLLLIFKWKKLNCTKKAKAGLIINGIMGMIMTANVIYWIV